MKDARPEGDAPRPPLDPTTLLALIRTRAALDRTLLAWIRTAFALAGFGFTLATYVQDWVSKGVLRGIRPETPRRLGLTLLVSGALGLLGGSIEYCRSARKLARAHDASVWSVALAVAFLMVGISALMVMGAMLKTGPF
ncbi:Hypothetical protein A7982_06932 [Minicystis rosea]|nr:Hypothetical protein A7982_06932 [Minicystis rosea]